MNVKKSAIITGIVFICAVFAITIVIGINRQEKVQAAIQKQDEILIKAEAEANKKAEQELAALAPNGSLRSYIDDIRYQQALNDHNRPYRIAALGSSVTAGTGASDPSKSWFSLLVNDLKNVDGHTSISYTNAGFGGYTSGELLSERKVDRIIELRPDMVLFEICVLNDLGEFVPIDETLKNIETVVDLIKEKLPDTKVILLSPNNIIGSGKTQIGLSLSDYVEGAKKLAKEKNLDFIDVYGEFVSRATDLNDYLSDGIHPNDKGYELWFEFLKAEFEKKK